MKAEAPRRIVVKVGTSTLTDEDGGLDRAYIADLAAQLAAQRAAGRDVLLVSSGAIRAGRQALAEGRLAREPGSHRASPIPPASSLPYKQAAAAVGQGLLMHTYAEAFAWRRAAVAQVLLTRDDLADRKRFLNARNTLLALLALGVVPIINENDTVAVDEIRIGDNDTLAARVGALVEADLLLILSDVEGLYDRPAAGGPSAASAGPGAAPALVSTVARIDAAVEAMAGGVDGDVGTGGMRTKVEAARIATALGIRTVIAHGRRERVVADVVEGARLGTTFLPSAGRVRGRKRWIAAGSRPRGFLQVNAQAAGKLRGEGASLLAAGIVCVGGDFAEGALVEVRDEDSRRFARGLTNYGSDDLRRVQGMRTDQFEAVLGAKPYDEVIHRDNMVVEG